MATTITTPPAKAWHQVTDQALNVPANGPAQMKRVYKLPISGCANIMNGIQLNAGISDVETWVRTSAGSLDTGISATNFTPQSGYHWILQSFYLDEPEAGEYAILKCVFSQTDMDIDAISHLSSWTEEVSNLSSVTWQAYSVSPYIYCDEVDHNDVKWYKGDNLTSDTGHALRRHIEQAYTQNAQDSDNNWQLWRNQNTTYLLTDSEQAIMKKVAAGVNPNTVQRSLEELESKGVLYSVRGSGWFVGEDVTMAKQMLRNMLAKKTADYFAAMAVLGMDTAAVKEYVKEWKE